MKTVDALIAARNFFVANPSRWTRASLHAVRGGKDCFCVLGGIANATGCINDSGSVVDCRVVVSCTKGPVSAKGDNNPNSDYVKIEELPQSVLKEFEALGIHLKAARGAVKYANAATSQLYPNRFSGAQTSIMTVNDTIGYCAVINCLNLAIKNAKRRHINGDRKKAA